MGNEPGTGGTIGTRDAGRATARRRRALRWCAAGIAGLAIPVLSTGAAGAKVGGTDAPTAEPVPGAEWTVEAPEAHGMDPVVLDGARRYAFQDGRNTQGVVVVRHGVIVGEWYAPGSDPSSPAASWSMAKSFTSSLIGIALEQGRIPSVDEPMTTYFPEWAGTPKAAITLRDVLHMESGLDWDENYDPSALGESEIIDMVANQPDQLAFASGIASEVAPGTRFNYSSGDTMLLSGVIEKATGMSVGAYARQELLDPIGIRALDWWRDTQGHTLTYCCVDTSSRNFARFGLLYLREGAWGDDQVVPADWVLDSVTDTANSYSGYGYQWWLSPSFPGSTLPAYFSAVGHDGQYIHVFPSLDLVVVRNGTYVKSPCPPVADPSLLFYYPPSGLVPGQGTAPPSSWSDEAFLGPIVEAITGEELAAATARPAADPTRAAAAGPREGGLDGIAADPAPCPVPPTTTPPPGAVLVTPRFTG